MRDACRELLRLLERRVVDDRRRIENGDIGEDSRLQEPAIVQPYTLCSKRSHFPNRELERDHRILSHVASEYSREGAEPAWMPALPPFARGIRTACSRILADGDPRLLHRQSQSILIEREVERARPAPVCYQEIEGSVVSVARAPHPGDLRQSLSLVYLEGIGIDFIHHRPLCSANPGCTVLSQLLFQTGTNGRIPEARNERIAATFLHPRIEHCGEAGSARRVRVLIGRDVDSRAARRVDECQCLLHLLQ